MNSSEAYKIIKSVKDHNFVVTAADICSDTGFSLSDVVDDLENLSIGTNGVIEVCAGGERIYRFRRNLESFDLPIRLKERLTEMASSVPGLVAATCSSICATAAIIINGVTFVLCLAFACCFMPLFTLGHNSEMAGIIDSLDRLSRTSTKAIGRVASASDQSASRQDCFDHNGRTIDNSNNDFEGSLAESFKSCFFGDSEAQEKLLDVEMKLVAGLLARNHGVVIEEELRPFLRDNPLSDEVMHHILQSFEGYPEVLDTGTVIYIFPSFASVTPEAPTQAYLTEPTGKFTHCSPGALAQVVSLSTLTIVSAYWLRAFCLFFAPISGIMHAISFVIVAALICLTVPLLRLIVIALPNKRIAKRNAIRHKSSELLKSPGPALQIKLQEARTARETTLRVENNVNVVYTTGKDLLEQRFEKMAGLVRHGAPPLWC